MKVIHSPGKNSRILSAKKGRYLLRLSNEHLSFFPVLTPQHARIQVNREGKSIYAVSVASTIKAHSIVLVSKDTRWPA